MIAERDYSNNVIRSEIISIKPVTNNQFFLQVIFQSV